MTRTSVGWLVLLIAYVSAAPTFAADANLQLPAEIAAGATLSIGLERSGRAGRLHQHRQAGNAGYQLRSVCLSDAGQPGIGIKAPSRRATTWCATTSLAGYVVIASAQLKVTDVAATLEPAPTVGVGGDLTITWTGPKQPSDFISIDKPGAPDTTYGPYAYATQGSPAKIRAPDAPGDYVVRYHMAGGYRVIGSAPVRWSTNRDAVRPGARPQAVVWRSNGPGRAIKRTSSVSIRSGAPTRSTAPTPTRKRPHSRNRCRSRRRSWRATISCDITWATPIAC